MSLKDEVTGDPGKAGGTGVRDLDVNRGEHVVDNPVVVGLGVERSSEPGPDVRGSERVHDGDVDVTLGDLGDSGVDHNEL